MKALTALRLAALLAATVALLFCGEAAAQQAPATLRVGVAGSVPFVLPAVDGEALPRGLSVEVWREIAARNAWPCTYRRVGSTEELLSLLESGAIDVAVGPTSITADRAARVAFSQPYQDASLAILAPPSRGYLDRARGLLSRSLAAVIGGFVALLLIVGTLVWLAERRRNAEQFPPSAAAGVGNGMWFALVTMTTVGYGDRAPVTLPGRLVAGLWMVAALVLTSTLTASLTTAFTLAQLDDALSVPAELSGRRVATVRGTTSERFIVRHGARPVLRARLDDAVRAVTRGEADALVFDRPVLRHYLYAHPEVDLRLSEGAFDPQGYGFAVRLLSPLRPAIDVALLSLHQGGDAAAIAARWLGR